MRIRPLLAGHDAASSASGGDVVVVDEAAEDRATPDPRGVAGACWGSDERHWWPLIPALVRPTVVVVGRVFGEHGPQVRLVDDEEPVQALRADRADGALCNGVSVRCPGRRLDDRDRFGREDGVEAGRELPVPIADEEAEGLDLTILQLPAELARLLGVLSGKDQALKRAIVGA